MTITLTHPGRTDISAAFTTDAEPRTDVVSPEFACTADRVEYDPDPVVVAVQRHADATARVASTLRDETDPQAWLFAQRSRYLREGACDPYAQLMLLRVGLLPVR